MSYAIIETGGKQVRVEPGRFYDIELLPVEPEEKVSIERVLLVQHNGDVHIGQPLVTGATVEGTVLRHMRARKIIVYKMRPKKKTRKKQGHRQEITRLMINSISLNGSVLADEQAAQQGVAAGDTTPAAVSAAAETIAPPPVADEPDPETIAPPPVADEPDPETIAPLPVADEPDPETAAPEETPENTAE